MHRECFPRHRFQRKPLVNDPGMHHGTCATHVMHMTWCMSGSLTRCGGEHVPGASATRNFRYLARDPYHRRHFESISRHIATSDVSTILDCTFDFNKVFGTNCILAGMQLSCNICPWEICGNIWGLWRLKQFSLAWINDYIPRNTLGYNYLSLSRYLRLVQNDLS